MPLNIEELLKSSDFHIALNGALASAKRSCDPTVKVGAATISENRLVLGWNHLPFGFTAPDTFWATQSERRLFVTHAEVAVCSQLRPYEARWLLTTRKPCPQCLILIGTIRIRDVFYLTEGDYADSNRVASAYGIRLHFLTNENHITAMPDQTNQSEFEFLAETQELLREHGSVSLPFVTAQFQPYSSKDRPDLVFIHARKSSGAVFVELKLSLHSLPRQNFVQVVMEHADFARSDSAIPLKFLFATTAPIPAEVRDQLGAANVRVVDNVSSSVELANAIIEYSQYE